MKRILIAAALVLSSGIAEAGFAQTLRIHHIDVDQGDATLLVMPGGRTLLVDAGLDSRGSAVAAYLASLGIDRLDAFVLTHYDADHMGGVDVLVEDGVSVEAFYDRGGWSPPACGGSSQMCEYEQSVVAEAGGATALHPGDQIVLDPDVSIVVVASNGRVHRLDPAIQGGENGWSVALLISYRGFNYLVAGDLTEPVEARLVEQAAIGDIDMYHVNHHGSETSSSEAFLRLIRPEVAIVSAGSHCGYHHPRQTILDRIAAAVPGVAIYQTNRYECDGPGGNVTAQDRIGDLEPDGAEGAVLVTIDADGYTVRVARLSGVLSRAIQRPD